MNKNKQRGYLSGNGWAGFLICLMLVSAVVGWGFIEVVIWLFSHITIGVV